MARKCLTSLIDLKYIHMQQMGSEWEDILFEADAPVSSDPLHDYISVEEIPDSNSWNPGSMEALVDQRRQERKCEQEMQKNLTTNPSCDCFGDYSD